MIVGIERIGIWLDLAARRLTQLCVGVMVVVVTLQVVWRYFLKSPIFWAEELARYGLVWMSFIGAAVALRAGQLACMDLLVNLFPAAIKRVVVVIVTLTSFALLLFLFWYSLVLVGQPSVVAQRSPAMRVPMYYVYLAMPVGLGLMAIQSFLQLLHGILRKGE
jgi:TRAP-type C4-dicarboxylate transport system permease small subunit